MIQRKDSSESIDFSFGNSVTKGNPAFSFDEVMRLLALKQGQFVTAIVVRGGRGRRQEHQHASRSNV